MYRSAVCGRGVLGSTVQRGAAVDMVAAVSRRAVNRSAVNRSGAVCWSTAAYRGAVGRRAAVDWRTVDGHAHRRCNIMSAGGGRRCLNLAVADLRDGID